MAPQTPSLHRHACRTVVGFRNPRAHRLAEPTEADGIVGSQPVAMRRQEGQTLFTVWSTTI